mgnify:CR=1 FL=1
MRYSWPRARWGMKLTVGAAGTFSVGGFMLPRSVLDARMPNARWYASAYFFISAPTGVGPTVSLLYTKDDFSDVVLGTLALTAGSQATNVKRSIEPVEITQYKDAETVLCVRLKWVLTGTNPLVVPGPATIVLTGKRRTANDQ